MTGADDKRGPLRNALENERRRLDELTTLAASDQFNAGHVLSASALLEAAHAETSKRIAELRQQVSMESRRSSELSIRQYVLGALDSIGTPQNADFLEEFVLATEHVSLNTRGFGALRRDERRSWMRNPGQRVAYVVACLDGEGKSVSSWMARSDWPLDQRLVVPGSERYFRVAQISALMNAQQSLGDETQASALDALVEDRLHGIASEIPELMAAWQSRKRKEFTSQLDLSLERARAQVDKERTSTLRSLREPTLEESIWGWA